MPMFIISKLMGFLSSPISLIVFFIALALLIKKYKKHFIVISILIFLFFSQPLVFRGVVKQWEGAPQHLMQNDSTHKYLVVLGGMSSFYEETNRIRFWQSGDRLMQALWLYKNNNFEKFIISGGTAAILIDEVPESIFLSRYLQEVGIDENEIVIDSLSRNTFENALECSKIFENNHWKKEIVLVTSSWHLPRAKWCFEQNGFHVYPVGADFLYPINSQIIINDFIPSLSVLQKWELILKEWIGILYYKIRY